MFYRWVRVKRVMSELWDPEDLTIKAGRERLLYLYGSLCDDPDVRAHFGELLEVVGEDDWQKAAARWHQAIDRYTDRIHGRLLRQQVIEVLQGQRLDIL